MSRLIVVLIKVTVDCLKMRLDRSNQLSLVFYRRSIRRFRTQNIVAYCETISKQLQLTKLGR